MTHPEAYLTENRLPRSFYTDTDVVQLSRRLLGQYLVTRFESKLSAGRIVETEAYRGPDDRASHAWNNRRTARTEYMFHRGGTAYVYLCYGIHHLFNVVTGEEDVPHAVLIRALQPVHGLDLMLQRRGLEKPSGRLSAGPGTLSQALGICTRHTGLDLCAADSPIWLSSAEEMPDASEIKATPRIGIDYAGEWAKKPWRFVYSPAATDEYISK